MEEQKSFAGFHRPEENSRKTVEMIHEEQEQAEQLNYLKKLLKVIQVGGIAGAIIVILLQLLLTTVLLVRQYTYIVDERLFYTSLILDVAWMLCFVCLVYIMGKLVQHRHLGTITTIRKILLFIVISEVFRIVVLMQGAEWIWTVFTLGWCLACYIRINNIDDQALLEEGGEPSSTYKISCIIILVAYIAISALYFILLNQ